MAIKTYTISSNSSTVAQRIWGDAGENFITTGGGNVGYLGNPLYTVGETSFLFSGVDIPKDAVITSAYLTLKTGTSVAGTVNLDIQAFDENDSVFSIDFSDFGSKARTTANYNWSFTPSANTVYTTPDIKSIIQEIVNRSGWSSGNDLQLVISDHIFKYPDYDWESASRISSTTKPATSNITLEITYEDSLILSGPLPIFYRP